MATHREKRKYLPLTTWIQPLVPSSSFLYLHVDAVSGHCHLFIAMRWKRKEKSSMCQTVFPGLNPEPKRDVCNSSAFCSSGLLQLRLSVSTTFDHQFSKIIENVIGHRPHKRSHENRLIQGLVLYLSIWGFKCNGQHTITNPHLCYLAIKDARISLYTVYCNYYLQAPQQTVIVWELYVPSMQQVTDKLHQANQYVQSSESVKERTIGSKSSTLYQNVIYGGRYPPLSLVDAEVASIMMGTNVGELSRRDMMLEQRRKTNRNSWTVLIFWTPSY